MTTTEETLATFVFLFLKHLSIELSNLIIVSNNHRLPTKSILRKSLSFYDKNLSLNQNNSILLTPNDSLNRRKVLFTHVDSYQFDPQIPCRFVGRPQREEFYSSIHGQQMQCLCHHHHHHHSQATLFIKNSNPKDKNKCKVKHKRQQRFWIKK